LGSYGYDCMVSRWEELNKNNEVIGDHMPKNEKLDNDNYML